MLHAHNLPLCCCARACCCNLIARALTANLLVHIAVIRDFSDLQSVALDFATSVLCVPRHAFPASCLLHEEQQISLALKVGSR